MNTDATAGRPLTRFGGDYETLADVAASHNVEIHGSPVYNATAQRYQIHATRIEKLDSRSHYRVSGAASAVAAGTLRINGLTVTDTADAIRPAGATVADGVGVVVFGTQLQVQARARSETDVVVATDIQCAVMPGLRPRELVDQGLLWPVDVKARTFGLNDARTGQRVTVRWDDKTVFLGLPRPGSAELEIQMIRTVRVEGYQEGDVVVARVVRDVSAGAGRRDGDRSRRAPGAQDKPQPWVAYQSHQNLQPR